MIIKYLFGQFWWNSYVTSKLTLLWLSLIMSSIFFKTPSTVQCFDFLTFDILCKIDNFYYFLLEVFWHFGIWLITWATSVHHMIIFPLLNNREHPCVINENPERLKEHYRFISHGPRNKESKWLHCISHYFMNYFYRVIRP